MILFQLECNADAINEANERENARVVAEATGSSHRSHESPGTGSSHGETSGSAAQPAAPRPRRRILSLFGRRR